MGLGEVDVIMFESRFFMGQVIIQLLPRIE